MKMVLCNRFFHSIAILCQIVLLALASSDNRCPGGYYEGTTIDIGSYWYECRNGVVVPKGCLTEDHARIDIQETYDFNNMRMQCLLDSNGQLTMAYKSCFHYGREHSVGDQWDDGRTVFTCKRNGNAFNIESIGCMDGGRRVPLGDKIVRSELVYICRKNTEGVPTLSQWGCYGKDGRQYAVGESFDYDQFWYTCTADGDRVMVKCTGCLHEQRRLGSSDRFVKDDVVYECQLGQDRAEFKPYGCVQRDENNAKVERRLGCFWIEGQPPYQYEMTCKTDTAETVAVKHGLKCVYKVTGGSYSVIPGCYIVTGGTAIGCMSQSSENLKIVLFNVDENGYGNAPGGLRRC